MVNKQQITFGNIQKILYFPGLYCIRIWDLKFLHHLVSKRNLVPTSSGWNYTIKQNWDREKMDNILTTPFEFLCHSSYESNTSLELSLTWDYRFLYYYSQCILDLCYLQPRVLYNRTDLAQLKSENIMDGSSHPWNIVHRTIESWKKMAISMRMMWLGPEKS